MRLNVSAQIGLVRKGFAADIALKRLLAGVCPDVTLQQPGAGETLATVLTLAALVVSAHVHREGGHGHVNLLTVGTVASLLVHN